MGVWGMGVTQSDQYCEVYEQFMEEYDEGKPVAEITAEILESYLEEFEPDDGVLHDVYFALAKAEWMACEQSDEILDRVKQIIQSSANLQFYRELEATEEDLKLRKKNLEKFLRLLQSPRTAPRKRKHPNKPQPAKLEKGEVFWYRRRGTIYGAVILENIRSEVWLVALTEGLDREPKTAEEVLDADIYTLTWFAQLLPGEEIHSLGRIMVPMNYNGKEGLYYSQAIRYCDNAGIDATWGHTVCVRRYPGRIVRDLLDDRYISDYFRRALDLRKRIDLSVRLYGEESVKLF